MSWCWVVVASARDVIALRDGIAFARLARLCTGSGRRRSSCCWVGQCTMPDLVLFHAVPYTFRSRILYHILHLQQSRQLLDTWASWPSLGAAELLKLTRLFFDPKMGTYRWAFWVYYNDDRLSTDLHSRHLSTLFRTAQWIKGRMSLTAICDTRIRTWLFVKAG